MKTTFNIQAKYVVVNNYNFTTNTGTQPQPEIQPPKAKFSDWNNIVVTIVSFVHIHWKKIALFTSLFLS